MVGFVDQLRAILGPAHVLTSAEDTAPFLRDWRGRYQGQAICVARPADPDQVGAVLALCAEEGVAVVPQGGNTGLCGGGIPDQSGRALLLSLGRLNRVRDVDPENNTLTVEAGCTLQQVRDAAEAADRLFPLSLAAQGSAAIGGNLSTNAGGVNVLRYGNMRDLTLGLEVVLPDGRRWDGLRGLRKDNTGYDLKQLFIGAEGTLGIITAAVLRLYPRPREWATAWVALASSDSAVALLGRLRQDCGERVTGFELVGRPALDLVLKHIPGARDPIPDCWSPWCALVELTDTRQGPELATSLESLLGEEIQAERVLDASLACSLSQSEALWSLRENISEAQRIEGVSIKHDVSVPVSRMATFVRRAGEALSAAFGELRVVCFGHVGDGNLHYNLSRPGATDNAAFIAQTPEANRIVHDLVVELGGSISAEHGIGQLKRGELRRYKAPLELELMRRIKDALDPAGIMNPGKIL